MFNNKKYAPLIMKLQIKIIIDFDFLNLELLCDKSTVITKGTRRGEIYRAHKKLILIL